MKGVFVILFLLVAAMGFSQDVPPVTEQQLENLGDEAPEDDAFLQQLVFYRNNPLNLNTATPEDLYALRLLNELQVQSLVRHRQLFGKLLSIYELQAVQGFDLQTIRKLLPFVFVGEAQSIGEALTTRLRNGSQSVLFRLGRVLEKAKGYDTTRKTHYLGDPYRMQLRYTYQYKNLLYYGVVADKDAGEQFFRGAQRWGFDFYSVHLFARNLGKLKAVALGDYVVNLGQGLTQWQSMGFGKSSEVLAVKRQAPVLLPYRSAGEFNFNRGAAATAQWGAWEATTFVSYKKFSGNRVADSVERFTSFGTSGYYRTPSEVEDRYRLSDFSAGANFSYNRTSLKVGANAVFHRFSQPLQKSAEPYNLFAFSGTTLLLGSVDYSYTYKNVHFFGEAAVNGERRIALVQGALVSMDPKLDLSFLFRKIQKDYSAPFGNAFTESALPANETGFYAGIQLRPSAAWLVSAYADVYHFSFLRYRISSPARGRDFLVGLSYAPNKTFGAYLRFRGESKPLDPAVGVIRTPELQTRKNLRLHFSLEPHRGPSVKGRLEKTWFLMDGKREEGFLSFAETAIRPGTKWSGQLRLQYFQTSSYDTRIYAYESDVLYSFSIPAFFDKGLRYYININWHPAKRWIFWTRFAQTLYAGRGTVGSGLDETEGHRRTEVKAQVQYRF
ncbi:ComEA family DNA-binding protein [Flavisolibacter nicotianae]|uniref:ComEA family DNA-binding protein n=1 Tax=Flavisolibacter nicotianae TaxID=2364882 RepID=UPI0013C49644|nr:helix-hairpin-helix domain-containing protein [Flavisolibacter nicotianae]